MSESKDFYVIKGPGWEKAPQFIPHDQIEPYIRLFTGHKEASPRKLASVIDHGDTVHMTQEQIIEWVCGFAENSLPLEKMLTAQLRLEVGRKILDLLGGHYYLSDGQYGRKILYFFGTRMYPICDPGLSYLGDEFVFTIAKAMAGLGIGRDFTEYLVDRVAPGSSHASTLIMLAGAQPKDYYVAALKAVIKNPKAIPNRHKKEDAEYATWLKKARKEQGSK